MYGLERFGDFLVKLSPSKRPYRHKSIVMRYVQVELCNFLRVHDPVRFASLKVAGSPVQPHMVCKASFLSPTDWSVTGQEGRGIPLKDSEIDNLRQLYTMYSGALGLNAFLGSVVSAAAWQVRGRIWTGLRYFCSYYYNNDNTLQLGKGYCCVEYVAASGVVQFGVIREVLQHRPFNVKDCPVVFLFVLEPLHVVPAKPVDALQGDELPLPVVRFSGNTIWACQSQMQSHMYCLKPHSTVGLWYFLDLLN